MGSNLYHSAERSVRIRAVLTSLSVVAFAYLVGLVLVSLGISAASALGYTIESAPIVTLALQYVLLPAGFLLVVAAYLNRKDRGDLLRYRWPTASDVAWVLAGFLALLVASTIIGEILTTFGIETAQNRVILRGRENPVLFLLLLPVTVFFVAPGEELVYRGIVQGQFRRAWGPLPAVVVASALFGVAHSGALAGSGTIAYLAIATILGVILGAVYEYTENVVVPIAIHAAWNSMLYLDEWLTVVHEIAVLP